MPSFMDASLYFLDIHVCGWWVVLRVVEREGKGRGWMDRWMDVLRARFVSLFFCHGVYAAIYMPSYAYMCGWVRVRVRSDVVWSWRPVIRSDFRTRVLLVRVFLSNNGRLHIVSIPCVTFALRLAVVSVLCE